MIFLPFIAAGSTIPNHTSGCVCTHSLTNTTCINSSSVMELLGKLRLHHPVGKLRIVLDNAAYQRNYWVRWHAAFLDIELVFLPS